MVENYLVIDNLKASYIGKLSDSVFINLIMSRKERLEVWNLLQETPKV